MFYTIPLIFSLLVESPTPEATEPQPKVTTEQPKSCPETQPTDSNGKPIFNYAYDENCNVINLDDYIERKPDAPYEIPVTPPTH